MKKTIAALLLSLLTTPATALDYHYHQCTSILYLSGVFEMNDDLLLSRFLKQNQVETIYIHSRGGYVRPALSMVNTLNNKHPKVRLVVDKLATCLSSCAYLILGASNSFVDSRSNLGIHAPTKASDAILARWEELGSIPKGFTTKIKQRGSDLITTKEISQAGFKAYFGILDAYYKRNQCG